jgi:hypothetical protein
MTAVSVRREGVGSTSPRTTWIGLPCIRRAEQDCPGGPSGGDRLARQGSLGSPGRQPLGPRSRGGGRGRGGSRGERQ